MMLYHFHLAIGVRGWGYLYSPWWRLRSPELGARMCLTEKRSFVKAEESYRFWRVIEWLTSLTLYHDSQFLAFSTEVLAQPNWGTIAVVLLVPR